MLTLRGYLTVLSVAMANSYVMKMKCLDALSADAKIGDTLEANRYGTL